MKFKQLLSNQKYKFVRSIDELKALSLNKQDFVLFLNHGLVSRKTIRYNPRAKKPFYILNHIDNSAQRLSEAELMDPSYTHIGQAIAKRALAIQQHN